MHGETPMPPSGRACALLALVCLAAFLPSALSAGFLNFDDPRLFGPESELARAGLLGLFDPRVTIADTYLPVSHLSLWIDASLFGVRPLGPHLHSLALHILVAAVLARLLWRLGLGGRAATAAAAVFALHPALCESVLWVAGRKDLLSGLFVILALSTVARRARGELPRAAAVRRVAAFSLLAVYAKGTAIVVPLLAVPVVLLLGGRAALRRDAAVLGAAALPAGLAALHQASIAASIGTMGAPAGLGSRLAQVPGAFLHYLTTSVWPSGLNVLYPELDTLEAFRGALLPGLLAMLGFAAAVLWLAGRAPRVAAGLALWALALAPFNTAIPATSLAAADRYLYLALPGLALALAAVPRVGPVLAVAAALVLGLVARARAADFESSEAIWNASLAVEPRNAAARTNLALAMLEPEPLGTPLVGTRTYALDALAAAEAQLEEACGSARYPIHRVRAASALTTLARASQRFERAARFAAEAADAADRLDADSPVALGYRIQLRLDAARLARIAGDPDGARGHYERARQLAPEHPFVLCFNASLRLAEAADAQGRVEAGEPRAAAAEALLDSAAAADPELYELHWTRGEWARATGRLLAAEKHFRDAIDRDPSRPEAWTARTDLWLARDGMAETAARIAREGLRATADAGLRFRLALALTAAGRIEEARQHYEAYLAARPADRDAKVGLASVLAAIGMRQLFQATPDALQRLAERILDLDPTNPKALVIRAVAARGRHELFDALVLLEKAREAMPEDPEVLQLYADTLRDRAWQLKLQEDRPDAALEMFVQFLQVAPPGVPTEAVENLVEQEWKRRMQAGRDALVGGDPAAGEAAFRDARRLRPEQERAAVDYFLGLALFQRPGEVDPEALTEALACFERAASARRSAGGDPGLAVLYQVRTLSRLGRDDEALAVGRALVEAPDGVDLEVLERVRAAIER
jgi:tetratricopeptide (TPR) repeat protein